MNTTIMVQIADRLWTMEALHCACQLSRNVPAKIMLVKMIPVQHNSWLGREWGYTHLSPDEQGDMTDYEDTMQDYDLPYASVIFQYVTLTEAIAQAAEHVQAQLVYAKLPESPLPLWTKLQSWMLRRQLASQGCQWIQQPVYDSQAETSLVEALSGMNGVASHQTH